MKEPRWVVVGIKKSTGVKFLCYNPADRTEQIYFDLQSEAERCRDSLTESHGRICIYYIYREDEIDVDTIEKKF
jgi:hypothetical protein